MMSAGSAVSESRTAPRTDCSASRFCGGATGPSGMRGGGAWPLVVRSGMLTGQPSLGAGSDRSNRTFVRIRDQPATCGNQSRADCRKRERPPRRAAARVSLLRAAVRLLLLDHHGLDGRGHAVLDLDDDHARADGLDRLIEMDVALVDRDTARLLDRVHDVLRRDGAEEAPVVAGLV